jgi:hypothetical protein
VNKSDTLGFLYGWKEGREARQKEVSIPPFPRLSLSLIVTDRYGGRGALSPRPGSRR